MRLTPVENGFGVSVSEAPLRGAGLAGTAKAIEQALDEHLLVVIPGADFTQDEYIAFGASFGVLEDFAISNVPGAGYSLALSNLAPNGSILPADSAFRRNVAADAMWHTDHTYRIQRARYSMLLAETVPAQGGETEYCDTRAAYDALSEAMKERIDELVAVHSIIYSRSLAGFTEWSEEQRAQLCPVPQPLVFRNPGTGRKSLYLASHIAEIVGWPTGEARQLVAELIEHATQRRFVYAHRWQPGDVVIWDDRATMHRRAPYDDLAEARKLYTMRVIEPSELYRPDVHYEIH